MPRTKAIQRILAYFEAAGSLLSSSRAGESFKEKHLLENNLDEYKIAFSKTIFKITSTKYIFIQIKIWR